MGRRSQAGREGRNGLQPSRSRARQGIRRREGCKRAQSRGCAKVCWVTLWPFITTEIALAVWKGGRSAWFRASHSMSVDIPSPSWSWWAKPGFRVSMPCLRAQVSGMPSGEIWHSWSDSLVLCSHNLERQVDQRPSHRGVRAFRHRPAGRNDLRSMARGPLPRLRHRSGRGVLRHLKRPAAPKCASRTPCSAAPSPPAAAVRNVQFAPAWRQGPRLLS